MPPGLLFVTLQLLTALLRRDGGMGTPRRTQYSNTFLSRRSPPIMDSCGFENIYYFYTQDLDSPSVPP